MEKIFSPWPPPPRKYKPGKIFSPPPWYFWKKFWHVIQKKISRSSAEKYTEKTSARKKSIFLIAFLKKNSIIIIISKWSKNILNDILKPILDEDLDKIFKI